MERQTATSVTITATGKTKYDLDNTGKSKIYPSAIRDRSEV